jgi:hypothetical protein
MDLQETEARNDCAGKGQQQLNRPTNQREVNVRWSPACNDVSPGAEECPLLEEVTKQRNNECD